jgi:flagellar biosynthesis/type III secretory pathway protein FliH
MSEPAARAVPLARLFAQPLPEGPTLADQHAAEIAAVRARAGAEARSELAPRIHQLEAELASERAARAAESAEQRAVANAALSALTDSLAGAVVPLALAVAKAVLGAEPGCSDATLSVLVAQALAAAPPGDGGTLKLHPLHLSGAPIPPPGWEVVPDAALPPGTVVATVGPCLCLSSLELRLLQARERLEQRP